MRMGARRCSETLFFFYSFFFPFFWEGRGIVWERRSMYVSGWSITGGVGGGLREWQLGWGHSVGKAMQLRSRFGDGG